MEIDLDILGFISKKIPGNIRTCFVSGLIIGWITHFYMLTHKLPNWDDISQIDNVGMSNEVGRWMLRPLQHIGLRASNPAVHGTLFIILISIAACFAVAALELKSVSSIVLVPAIMITFPSVTGILYFMFTSHHYSFSIMLFCASAYYIKKYKYGFFISSLCIIFGLGIYQPFVSVAISLFLIVLIQKGLKGEEPKKLVKEGFVFAGTLALSTAIYILIARIIYPASGGEQYGGVDTMGHIPLADIPRNFGRVYKRVLEYFVTKPFAYIKPCMHYLNIGVCTICIVLAILCVIKRSVWKRKAEFIFTFVMLALFPFSIGFIYFMAPDAPFSTLMIYAYSMMYVLALVLLEMTYCPLENFENRGKKCSQIAVSVITVVLIALVTYNNYLVDAQAYFRTSIAMERVTNYYNRILSAVECMDGYKPRDPVAILGDFYYKEYPSPVEMMLFKDDDNYRELSGVALENGLITSGARNDFINTYMGFNSGRVSQETKDMLISSNQFKEMPIYPDEGSIVQIDGIWVVKLWDAN